MDKDLLLKCIKILENKESKLKTLNVKGDKIKNVKGEKVKDYRKQVEYGEKKFIKPWRTSTKSQQQPPKSGKKAGGRGVQRV